MGKNRWMGGFVVVLMVAGVVAQAPAPSSDCTSAITSLAPCLSYVSSGSNDTTPGKECCTALSTVVSTRVLCLCQVLSTNNTLGLPINRTRALALPSACNVKTPSISQCSAASGNAPGAAPAAGSASSPPASPPASPVITPAASPTAKSPAPSAKTPASTVFTPAPAPTTSSPAPTTAAPSPSPSATPSAAPAPTSPTPMSSPSPQAPSPTVPTPSNPDTASPSPTSSPPSPTGGGAAGSSPSGGGPSEAPSAGDKSRAVATFVPSTVLVLVGVALASIRW
eukprot:Gb_11754 [translate_table: standard]